MPVYRAKIVGRTSPILIKAESGAKARSDLVEVEALTMSEVEDLVGKPDALWTPGTPLPADEKPKEETGNGEG